MLLNNISIEMNYNLYGQSVFENCKALMIKKKHIFGIVKHLVPRRNATNTLITMFKTLCLVLMLEMHEDQQIFMFKKTFRK